MPEGPEEGAPRRRSRGRRRGGPPRPHQSPAQPERPGLSRGDRPPGRDRPPARPRPPGRDRAPSRDRPPQRDDARIAPRERGGVPARPAPGAQRDRRTRRGGRGRVTRSPDDIGSGTSCVILLDCREGEPDRSGAPALFEGFFDFETGEPRRPGSGIPRLRVGEERLWGFECWWRVDSERTGLTVTDHEELETSKRLLRGLLRDARRSTRVIR